jgi:hypothetical protein
MQDKLFDQRGSCRLPGAGDAHKRSELTLAKADGQGDSSGGSTRTVCGRRLSDRNIVRILHESMIACSG